MNNRAELRVLLSCLFAGAGAPVPVEPLKEGLHFGGIANYFECAYALRDLLQNGSLREESPGRYEITPAGAAAAETLRSGLPRTLLEKGEELVGKILKRERSERETAVTFEPVGNGCRVNCAILEGEREIMRVSLLMPDKISANRVREAFLDDPAGLYGEVLRRLAGV